ncbi:hypothetical protein E2562_010202 [Oryza meyeriana var. granulata]|uniref:Uncharacterized protein n=1 Tax=Oryza meyeriana var. granulata TaxID=110450 RepID=A0A6G1EKS7_9ORYZ|nr:hypothetical protein E2562_010202 [Oryza meyeriana var. granulata]
MEGRTGWPGILRCQRQKWKDAAWLRMTMASPGGEASVRRHGKGGGRCLENKLGMAISLGWIGMIARMESDRRWARSNEAPRAYGEDGDLEVFGFEHVAAGTS